MIITNITNDQKEIIMNNIETICGYGIITCEQKNLCVNYLMNTYDEIHQTTHTIEIKRN